MPSEPQSRIVSLIASATEIVCALGARERLVGRSHECDYPSGVLWLPALTEPKFKVEGSSADIDARVREIVRDGLSVYRVDGEALKALAPDVIVTQDHCELCAVSLADVEAATCTWTGRPVEIVSLRPDCMADVYADIAGGFTDHLDRHHLGRLNVEQWSIGMDRALKFRDGGEDGRFYDIDFRAMQADPIGEVQGLYAWLGEPVTEEFESGMRKWWSDNAENRDPSTHPDPETFGIDLDDVRPRFAEYTARAKEWTAH